MFNINGDLILNTVYPVGSLYLTTNKTNPSIFLGGTWEMITSDAYLKIVSSNAGNLGGTNSEHKIPLSSMPSHRHMLSGYRATSSDATASDKRPRMYSKGTGAGWDGGDSIGLTGDGQPYYPYYYGIYVFRRTK